MPDDSGMAFVLVAHLDPTHASLLARAAAEADTGMKVGQVNGR
jgi:hypothetical protein